MEGQYIGHLQYFATGEGRTEILASGSIEEIANFAESFYARGLTFFSFEEIRLAMQQLEKDEDLVDDNDRQDHPALLAAYNINYHLPAIAKTIKEGLGYLSFSYKLYINYS